MEAMHSADTAYPQQPSWFTSKSRGYNIFDLFYPDKLGTSPQTISPGDGYALFSFQPPAPRFNTSWTSFPSSDLSYSRRHHLTRQTLRFQYKYMIFIPCFCAPDEVKYSTFYLLLHDFISILFLFSLVILVLSFSWTFWYYQTSNPSSMDSPPHLPFPAAGLPVHRLFRGS